MDIPRRIADELSVPAFKVEAAVRLLDEGATVPFIARYRKEATGGLDDVQLRALEERLRGLRALEEERARVLRSIEEQGKLTEELRARIQAAETLARLEDLYLPFRPKRRTRAQIAAEAGLEPLAELLLAHPEREPAAQAAAFVAPERGVDNPAAALDGARELLLQRLAEDADLNSALREHLRQHGVVRARVKEGKEEEGARFRDYFAYDEPLARLPSHRALALFRGRAEGVLALELVDADPEGRAQAAVAARLGLQAQGRPGDAWLAETARLAWKVRLLVRGELALLTELRARAEADAISVFARNLRELLLAAPAGAHTTLGLDPGIRTGVKVAVVDPTGRVVATSTVYPFPPRNDEAGALRELERLVRAHGVTRVAIGNGTASRETDRLAGLLLERLGEPAPVKVVVSEAGASVYSASELASAELPELDVSLRGAVSIARRLQDPLAELVKIDPRSIGVGQYQHDVDPGDLGRALDAVVEDCVNAVGVELNTASPALLQRVAGLSASLARAIVAWRDAQGGFSDRKQLLEVPRLGPRTFEQCAGFLRIRGGANPLDASAVHPEAYPVVQRVLARTGRALHELMGRAELLRGLRPQDFTDERFGLPTVQDLLAELEKPGRDPRPEFRVARFREGVETLADLKPGMTLEGVVTNVTDFGAFVDVGVHQDGLVHISQLADRFIKDPHTVVRPGAIVTVRVLEVDLPRKRVSLTMRSADRPADRPADRGAQRPPEPPRGGGPRPAQRPPEPPRPAPRRPQEPFNPVFHKLKG